MIPVKIVICGVEYKVVWKPNEEMKREIGKCKYNIAEIWLNEKYKNTKDRAYQVFLHEVIHAVSFELNLDLKEDYVNNLAVGLYPIVELR